MANGPEQAKETAAQVKPPANPPAREQEKKGWCPISWLPGVCLPDSFRPKEKPQLTAEEHQRASAEAFDKNAKGEAGTISRSFEALRRLGQGDPTEPTRK